MSLGIQSVIFELGQFRTKIMDPSNLKTEVSAIADYDELNKAMSGYVDAINNREPGDPIKAVNIMIDVVKSEGVATGKAIPERLLLGRDVLEKIRKKYTSFLEACTEWEDVITSTDCKGTTFN